MVEYGSQFISMGEFLQKKPYTCATCRIREVFRIWQMCFAHYRLFYR